jgi:hypothetical protein
LQQFGGQDQPIGALLADQNAFDISERAGLDANPVSTMQKWMGFDVK